LQTVLHKQTHDSPELDELLPLCDAEVALRECSVLLALVELEEVDVLLDDVLLYDELELFEELLLDEDDEELCFSWYSWISFWRCEQAEFSD
jgi:hypothetical protein